MDNEELLERLLYSEEHMVDEDAPIKFFTEEIHYATNEDLKKRSEKIANGSTNSTRNMNLNSRQRKLLALNGERTRETGGFILTAPRDIKISNPDFNEELQVDDSLFARTKPGGRKYISTHTNENVLLLRTTIYSQSNEDLSLLITGTDLQVKEFTNIVPQVVDIGEYPQRITMLIHMGVYKKEEINAGDPLIQIHPISDVEQSTTAVVNKE